VLWNARADQRGDGAFSFLGVERPSLFSRTRPADQIVPEPSLPLSAALHRPEGNRLGVGLALHLRGAFGVDATSTMP